MTMQELIEKLGRRIGCPSLLYTISFINAENVSYNRLEEYFGSKQYQNDVFNCVSEIDRYKHQNISNFALYFETKEDGSLKMVVKLID